MASTIAKYFSDELSHWERTIAFYFSEIDGLTTKLNEVITRNSVPRIAEKVEVQQTRLDQAEENFSRLHMQFEKQKATLKANSAFIDDSAIGGNIEVKQQELRRHMIQAEKEYIEARTACQLFLSDMFKTRSN